MKYLILSLSLLSFSCFADEIGVNDLTGTSEVQNHIVDYTVGVNHLVGTSTDDQVPGLRMPASEKEEGKAHGPSYTELTGTFE